MPRRTTRCTPSWGCHLLLGQRFGIIFPFLWMNQLLLFVSFFVFKSLEVYGFSLSWQPVETYTKSSNLSKDVSEAVYHCQQNIWKTATGNDMIFTRPISILSILKCSRLPKISVLNLWHPSCQVDYLINLIDKLEVCPIAFQVSPFQPLASCSCLPDGCKRYMQCLSIITFCRSPCHLKAAKSELARFNKIHTWIIKLYITAFHWGYCTPYNFKCSWLHAKVSHMMSDGPSNRSTVLMLKPC